MACDPVEIDLPLTKFGLEQSSTITFQPDSQNVANKYLLAHFSYTIFAPLCDGDNNSTNKII